MTVSSIDADDPSQKSVVALASGGRLRARAGEAWASYLFVVSLSVIGIAVAFSRAWPVPTLDTIGPQLFRGLLVLFPSAFMGVALGYLFAWPVLQRTPLTLSVVFLVSVLVIVVPLSPVHSLLVVAETDAELVEILGVTSRVLLLAAACIGVGSLLVGPRWRLTRPG